MSSNRCEWGEVGPDLLSSSALRIPCGVRASEPRRYRSHRSPASLGETLSQNLFVFQLSRGCRVVQRVHARRWRKKAPLPFRPQTQRFAFIWSAKNLRTITPGSSWNLIRPRATPARDPCKKLQEGLTAQKGLPSPFPRESSQKFRIATTGKRLQTCTDVWEPNSPSCGPAKYDWICILEDL